MLSFAASVVLVSLQAAPAVAPTRQQLFDRATQAMDAGKCDEAVRGFQGIEADTSRKLSPSVAGTIAIRKGSCLIRLGRGEEGAGEIRRGVAMLSPLGAAHADDIRLARLTLGRLAALDYDYGAAEQEYAGALAVSSGVARVEPLLLMARVTMFDEDAKALAYADEALTIISADPAGSKDLRAIARTARARVLLNRAENKAGYDDLKEALRLQGGLSLKIDLADAGTRADLALAALLNNDRDNARRYMAYTGAGRMSEAPFARAISLETPVCGDEAGLRPEDSAVIEFGLDTDGSVSHASPIWSSGDRAVAIEFARAVRNWSWTPEEAAKIPAFYRAATRVQLRCSTVGERPATTDILEEKAAAWLIANGAKPFVPPESDARAAPMIKAQLANAAGIARIAPLAALARNPVLPEKERVAYAEEGSRIARETNAPAAVRTWLGLRQLYASLSAYMEPEATQAKLRQMLADPAVQADAASTNVLRLSIAQTGGRKDRAKDADQLLAAIVADDRLAKDDPVKVAALLEQSTRAARSGQIEQARATFEQTGLNEAQCALIGPRPAMRSSGTSSADFPMEALRWGFEGWVRTEFDIQADGRTARQRAIASYPPFVFDDAATDVAQGMRYEATYRPSGGSACSGQQQQIVFQLP